MPDGFSQFWAAYPRRIGKLAAQKAYQKARRGASAEEILAGLEAYMLTMPREERFRPHPATWLNQGRWMDEFPERQRVQPQEDWFDQCRRLHDLRCNGRYGHAIQMGIDAERAASEESVNGDGNSIIPGDDTIARDGI